MCERGSDAEQTSRCSEPIHQPIHGQMQAFLPSLEERGRFSREQKMRDSFPRFEEIYGFTITIVQAHLGRNVVPLSSRLKDSCEQGPNLWGWRHQKAGLLHQTFHEWTTNQIPKARKIGARSLPHLEEAQALQTFPITVLTEHPLRSVIENSEVTRRILKWALELRPYGLIYEPRTTIKGHTLTDFIADFTPRATKQCDLLEWWFWNK